MAAVVDLAGTLVVDLIITIINQLVVILNLVIAVANLLGIIVNLVLAMKALFAF